ncbi:MAG: sensor histidine kinase [Ginsengibacter sp.]
MRKLYFIFYFSCCTAAATAQGTDRAVKVDSLLKLISTAKEDTAKAMLLLTIGDCYQTNNQDSASFYLEKGKALSQSLHFDKGLYYYYQTNTVLSYTKGEYAIARTNATQGLVLARKLGDSSKAVAMLNNMAIIQAYFGNYKEQLQLTLEVVRAVEKMKDSAKISGAYHNLANCYHNLGQYRKGVNAASYSVNTNRIVKQKNGYINRANSTLAQCYEGLNMYDSSLHFYRIAISESQRLNDKYAEGMIYGYTCNLLAEMNRFKEMLTTAQQSLSLSKKLQSRQMMAGSLFNIAYAEYFNRNNVEAKKYIYEALNIASKDSLKDELKNTYTILSYIAAKDGDFKTSLFAKQKADSIIAASLNEEVLISTTDLEKKYETEKKEAQIKQLEAQKKVQQLSIRQKNIFNYILLGGFISLLMILLMGLSNYKQKQKLQQQRITELETEKKLTATEAVLKGEEQERTRLAKDLHDGLGGMLSGIKYSMNTMKGNLIMTPENTQAFERSIDMLDSSIKEMRRVAHNMMPEALVKFGLDSALNDFCNDINQTGALKVNYQSIGLDSAAIDQTTGITIYRIVQELLNNIMKHAAAKNAIVQVSKFNGLLSVTVEDDGKGFDPVILKGAKGIGWTNIQNRVEFLKGKLDINSQAGKGTSVLIELNT